MLDHLRLLSMAADALQLVSSDQAVAAWCCDVMLLSVAGKINREVVVSQSAAAMLAWFSHQLRPTTSAGGTVGSIGDTGGGGGTRSSQSLQAVLAATPAPLLSTALVPAADAVAVREAGQQALAAEDITAADSLNKRSLADQFEESFLRWVRLPSLAPDVTFRVK
jgi:hypothetical protein